MAKYRIKTHMDCRGVERYTVQRKILGLLWVDCIIPFAYADGPAIFPHEEDAKAFISKRKKIDSYKSKVIKVN